jgi:hypothetical protein
MIANADLINGRQKDLLLLISYNNETRSCELEEAAKL